MCKTDNLASMMSTMKIMSIIDIVLAFVLLICGIVATTYKAPNWCEEDITDDDWYSDSECKEDYDSLSGVLSTIALWGTLPAIIPLVFGGLALFASLKKQTKCMVGTVMAFTIVGVILCIIGIALPYFGAIIVTAICHHDPEDGSRNEIRDHEDGKDFCDRYGGSLWAVVVLNIILAIYQFAFSIVLCCQCCAKEEIWTGVGAPAGQPMQQMQQPVPGQPVAQGDVPMAMPVQ